MDGPSPQIIAQCKIEWVALPRLRLDHGCRADISRTHRLSRQGTGMGCSLVLYAEALQVERER